MHRVLETAVRHEAVRSFGDCTRLRLLGAVEPLTLRVERGLNALLAAGKGWRPDGSSHKRFVLGEQP